MNRRKAVRCTEWLIGITRGVLCECRESPALRQALAAVGCLALLVYFVAGWPGLALLGLVAAVGAAYRPLRQRVLRWYLLHR